MNKFNKEKLVNIVNKIPYIFILILMIVIAPLGVYFFLIKKEKDRNQIYNKSKNLSFFAMFIIFLLGIGIYSKIREIIELYSSGMSLDMMNFIPDNLWLYLIGLIICISFIYGSKKLMERAKIDRKYIDFINIKKESSIEKISKQLNKPLYEVIKNIKILQDNGVLININIDEDKNKIIYRNKKSNIKVLGNKNRVIQCSKCGAIVKMKLDEYVECDFCGHGLIEENNQL